MSVLTRVLTSFFYVGILLGSLYLNPIFFGIVICTMATITIYEAQQMVHQHIPITYLFFPLIFLVSNYNKLGNLLILILGVLGVVLSVYYFVNNKRTKMNSTFVTLLGFFGIAIPMALLTSLGIKNPELVAFMFGIIWLNDSGAYFVGSMIGKRPLAPYISPNKTVEGFVGGLLISVVVMLFIGNHLALLESNTIIPIIFIIALTSSIGDLVQSKIKRQCGVKDSGKILPGHGGMYDRIDSTLLAVPVFSLLLFLIGYVS